MRVHQIENPARCSYCNKNFLRMDCLVRHVRSKHRETLQQIIVEAETNRIISAQSNIVDGEEIEIIVYNDEYIKPEDNVGTPIEYVEEEEEECEPIFLDDDLLKKRIQELLEIVIEESLLKELGYLKKPIDEVLCSVLEQCSRTPIRKSDGVEDDSTRMRENTKQLFSMVLDEDHIKSLLNNYTVDEVITIVLKMAK
jgi:KRAB domain-containing zinc finger protein